MGVSPEGAAERAVRRQANKEPTSLLNHAARLYSGKSTLAALISGVDVGARMMFSGVGNAGGYGIGWLLRLRHSGFSRMSARCSGSGSQPPRVNCEQPEHPLPRPGWLHRDSAQRPGSVAAPDRMQRRQHPHPTAGQEGALAVIQASTVTSEQKRAILICISDIRSWTWQPVARCRS